jgi:hypothetical protein
MFLSHNRILAVVTAAAIAHLSVADPIAGPFGYGGHLYYLLPQSNWTDAQAAAVALGGHLVTINDAAENDFVFGTFSSFGGVDRALWLGLTDAAQEGTFVWISGEPVTYTNWGPDEPNNCYWCCDGGAENYVHIFWPSDPRSPQWNDMDDEAAWCTGDLPLFGVAEVIGGPCPGDLDGDLAVSLQDLANLLSNFGTPGGAEPDDGDLDADGDVDQQDLTSLLSEFGTFCR